MIAARVVAELQNEQDVKVDMVKGGLGELSVAFDGKKVYSANRLLYPTPTSVLKKVRSALEDKRR